MLTIIPGFHNILIETMDLWFQTTGRRVKYSDTPCGSSKIAFFGNGHANGKGMDTNSIDGVNAYHS